MKNIMIRLGLIGVGLAFGFIVVDAWLTSRTQQRQLRAVISEEEKIIRDADKSEADRKNSVEKALGGINKLKEQTHTPAQVLRQLPLYLSLPEPLRTASPSQFSPGFNAPVSGSITAVSGLAQLRLDATKDNSGSEPTVPSAKDVDMEARKTTGATSPVQIPTSDLKPLFDYVQDCRACETELKAAHEDASDMEAKLEALTHGRDEALRAAKGGTAWRRFCRNLRWFAVGAAGGFLASRM